MWNSSFCLRAQPHAWVPWRELSFLSTQCPWTLSQDCWTLVHKAFRSVVCLLKYGIALWSRALEIFWNIQLDQLCSECNVLFADLSQIILSYFIICRVRNITISEKGICSVWNENCCLAAIGTRIFEKLQAMTKLFRPKILQLTYCDK